MTINLQLLAELIPLVAKKVEAANAETDGIDWSKDFTAYRARTDAANERLTDFFRERYGARFNRRPPHDHAVAMAGIRSSSTSGVRGALQNWRTAAQKKLAQAKEG